MYIDVSQFKKELICFNEIVKKYEDNIINLFYILEHSSDFWEDGRSSIFYDDLYNQKNEAMEMIQEVKIIISIFTFVENEYSQIGNKVEINLEEQNELLLSLDDLIDSINGLSNNYENLNLWFNPIEFYDIIAQKNSIVNIKQELNNYRKKIANRIDLINKIEDTLLSKISKITISEILQNNRDYFVQTEKSINLSKAYIGKDDLQKVISKINIYTRDQELIGLDLKENADSLAKYYVSKNSKILKTLYLEIINNMDLITKNFNYAADVLNNVILLHEEVVEDYKKNLDGIIGGD